MTESYVIWGSKLESTHMYIFKENLCKLGTLVVHYQDITHTQLRLTALELWSLNNKKEREREEEEKPCYRKWKRVGKRTQGEAEKKICWEMWNVRAPTSLMTPNLADTVWRQEKQTDLVLYPEEPQALGEARRWPWVGLACPRTFSEYTLTSQETGYPFDNQSKEPKCFPKPH